MRVTVCELPHEPDPLARAWEALCQHTVYHRTELLLLPEFAMVEPVWQHPQFELARWEAAQALSATWLDRLNETGSTYVVGTRPATIEGRRFNQGFLWSRELGVQPLRRKCFLPEEPGWWERRWFERGDPEFKPHRAGGVQFGLNICTELWAVETFSTYAEQRVPLILTPRATSIITVNNWLALGAVAALRSGAYSLSSNRCDDRGANGGTGWIIAPDGEVLAITTPNAPFATREIELAGAGVRTGYPGYVFADLAASRIPGGG